MAKRSPLTFNGTPIGSGKGEVPWNTVNLGTPSSKSAPQVQEFLKVLSAMTLADQKAIVSAAYKQHNATIASAIQAKVKYDDKVHKLVVGKFGWCIADKGETSDKPNALSLVA